VQDRRHYLCATFRPLIPSTSLFDGPLHTLSARLRGGWGRPCPAEGPLGDDVRRPGRRGGAFCPPRGSGPVTDGPWPRALSDS
jgi:hypothetical protein